MKTRKFLLPAATAGVLALTLSACGGSDGNMLISGSFSGVTKTGLVWTRPPASATRAASDATPRSPRGFQNGW